MFFLSRKKKDYQEETKYALELENWAVRGHIVTIIKQYDKSMKERNEIKHKA